MMDKLQRILNLANKTGDNVIVFDPQSGEPYVVVSFEKYETLAKKNQGTEYLTEPEITDKINPEMASWENEPNFSAFDEYQESELNNQEPVMSEVFTDEEDEEEMMSEPIGNFEPIRQVLERRDSAWQIPQERKAAAVDDEQYLEEITF
jgi:hypothetical protein